MKTFFTIIFMASFSLICAIPHFQVYRTSTYINTDKPMIEQDVIIDNIYSAGSNIVIIADDGRKFVVAPQDSFEFQLLYDELTDEGLLPVVFDMEWFSEDTITLSIKDDGKTKQFSVAPWEHAEMLFFALEPYKELYFFVEEDLYDNSIDLMPESLDEVIVSLKPHVGEILPEDPRELLADFEWELDDQIRLYRLFAISSKGSKELICLYAHNIDKDEERVFELHLLETAKPSPLPMYP